MTSHTSVSAPQRIPPFLKAFDVPGLLSFVFFATSVFFQKRTKDFRKQYASRRVACQYESDISYHIRRSFPFVFSYSASNFFRYTRGPLSLPEVIRICGYPLLALYHKKRKNAIGKYQTSLSRKSLLRADRFSRLTFCFSCDILKQ